ncbi:MAG: threonine-phosphate decarboxylase [Clostridium sartagoforme]|nr:threonine-phosphate decarboxylase [Clostridium sartagoforme]
MSKVVHGGNLDELSRNFKLNKEDLIDFSANINPLGLNNKVKEVIINALEEVERYPDITYFNLKSSISAFEGIEIDKLTLGNGAAEVIFNLLRAIKPKKVLLPAPTFGEYEEAALSVCSEIQYYYLKEERNWRIDEEINNYISDDIDMVFICNPNNPTGTITKKETIVKIVEKAKITNTIVVIDESFLDFLREIENYSAIKLLEKYNNVFIIKSMTKLFAMPGIRIGYGICNNKAILSKIEEVSVPWNINILAEKAAIFSLGEKEYINKTREYIEKEKDYLYEELAKFEDIKVFEPSVNFLMFKLNKEMDLKFELMKENIIIRSCGNYEGLDNNYYRIAVRRREENEKLIKTLKKVIN